MNLWKVITFSGLFFFAALPAFGINTVEVDVPFGAKLNLDLGVLLGCSDNGPTLVAGENWMMVRNNSLIGKLPDSPALDTANGFDHYAIISCTTSRTQFVTEERVLADDRSREVEVRPAAITKKEASLIVIKPPIATVTVTN